MYDVILLIKVFSQYVLSSDKEVLSIKTLF